MRQILTIGSAEDCDIIVQGAGVESLHGRLHVTDAGCKIEDCRTSEGIRVDGERIYRATHVDRTKEIRLGEHTPLPWPKELAGLQHETKAVNRKVFRIGRSPDNEIVLQRAGVSLHHANLICEDGSYFIEDLDSAEGLAIGSSANLVQHAEVRGDDLVFFGSFSIKVTHLLAMAKQGKPQRRAKPTVNPTPPVPAVQDEPTLYRYMVLVSAIAEMCILIALFWVPIESKPNEQAVETTLIKNEATKLESRNQSDDSVDSKTHASGQQVVAKLLAPLGDGVAKSKAITSEAAFAMFTILIQDDESQARSIATAWLATPSLLITTGESIEAIRQSLVADGNVLAVQGATGIEIPVASYGFDPRYASARENFALVRRQYHKLRELMATPGGVQEDTAQKVKELVRSGETAVATQADCNLGWLLLATPVDGSMVVERETLLPLHAGAKLHLHANPIPNGHPKWQGAPFVPHGVTVTVDSEISSSQAGMRWRMSMPAALGDLNYLGSPVFNLKGRLVGIVSKTEFQPIENQSGMMKLEVISLVNAALDY